MSLYKSNVTKWRITDYVIDKLYDCVTYFLRIKSLRTLEKLNSQLLDSRNDNQSYGNRPPRAYFFGHTFDLVSGWQCICTCAVPHPWYLDLWEGHVLMIEQNECQEGCGCKNSHSSGDFKQELPPITTVYLQWTVWTRLESIYGHCSISPLGIIC